MGLVNSLGAQVFLLRLPRALEGCPGALLLRAVVVGFFSDSK
jgi:hypothetical protein